MTRAVRIAVLAGASILLLAHCHSESGRQQVCAIARPHAFLETESRPTELIDAGHRTARPHLWTGWSHEERLGNDTVAWTLGPRADVRFIRSDRGEVTVRLRVASIHGTAQAPQRVAFDVNGVEAGVATVAHSLSEVEIRVPEGLCRRGENSLTLRPELHGPALRGGAVADPRDLGILVDWIAFRGTHELPRITDEGTLLLPAGAGVTLHERLCAGSRLVWDDADAWRRPSKEGLRIDVQYAEDGQVPVRRVVAAAGGEVALQSSGERAGTLTVALTGEGDGGVQMTSLRVVHDGSCREPQTPRRAFHSFEGSPNVIVYLVDTLRRDRLGVYGHGGGLTPHFDAFAKEAVVHENAWAQSSWTRPSVASIFTGTSPFTHRVFDIDNDLPPELPTLAEVLLGRGYSTMASVANANLRPEFSFDRGFQHFIFFPNRAPIGPEESPAVLAEALRQIDARPRGRPFFSYIHVVDPHEPYKSGVQHRRRTVEEDPDIPANVDRPDRLRELVAGKPGLRDRAAAWISGLYDAEVAATDEAFGAFVAELKRRRLYEDSLIVLLSDHGEEFGEHGSFGHGRNLYQETLRIPLVVRYPRGLHGGTRAQGLVQHTDLFRFLTGENALSAPVLSHLAQGGNRADSLVIEDLHLMRYREATELYRPGADPGEMRNEATRAPSDTDWASRMMRRLEIDASAAGVGQRTVTVSRETQDMLRALGYLQGSGE